MEEQIKKYFLFYKNELLPKILLTPEVTQLHYGYHGLFTHTESVVFRGIFFALSMGKNPIPVIFACAGHDLARTGNEYDEIHGINAVPIISEIMKDFDNILTESEMEKVKNAIQYHTIGTIAPDYISACLWDADRTRLARGGQYHEKYFNTEIGKKIASGDPQEFIKFKNKCLGYDKEENIGHAFY